MPSLAGRLENTRTGMIRCNQQPQAIVPANVMPAQGIPALEAGDMATDPYPLR